MPVKVPQFEAIATKFVSCIDSVILNAFFLHAFDKHLKYCYKTNAHEFKPASFAQIHYLQKRLHYFGARAIF